MNLGTSSDIAAAAPVPVRPPTHPLLLVGAVFLGASLVVALALPPVPAATLTDVAQDAAVVAALAALALGWARSTGERRRVVGALLAALTLAGLGMVVAGSGSGPATQWVAAGLSLLAVVVVVVGFAIAIGEGLPRMLLIGTWLDTLVMFATASLIAGVAATRAADGPRDPATILAVQGLLVLGAWSVSASLLLLARRMRPALHGPWAVLIGALAVSVSGVAWRLLGVDGDQATVPVPTGWLLSGGVLLAAHGGLGWTMRGTTSRHGTALVRSVTDPVPLAGVVVALLLDTITGDAPGYEFVQGGLVAMVLLTGLRHLVLQLEGRRTLASQQAMEARLRVEVDDRDATLRSMTRLEPGDSLAETAHRISDEAIGLGGIDVAWLCVVGDDGVARVLATAGLPAGALVGRPAPPAPGSTAVDVGTVTVWVEHPEPGAGGHAAELAAAGVLAALVAPFRRDERLVGYPGVGTRSPSVAEGMPRRAATARELALIAGTLMGPTIAIEEHARRARGEVEAVIAATAFYPVFQPIAEVATGRVVGYEALTRFEDGRRPDVVFEVARRAGRGVELEVATLAAALGEAGALPDRCHVSLNISPDLAVRPELLGPLLNRAAREVVLEITEHVPVEDYERLVATLYALDLRIRIAVDDAGAGYAGLQHILSIRPQLVKLDIGLVRSVDVDIARQALISGMVGFTRRMDAVLVAEGVEHRAEADMLASLGVDLMQGYLVGRPARIGAPTA